MRSISSAQALGQSCGQTVGTTSSGKDRLRLDPTEYRDERARSRSWQTAPLFAAKRNHKFHRDCQATKSAADLQQPLAFAIELPTSPVSNIFGTPPGHSGRSASTILRRRSKSVASIARTKVSTTAAIVAASPGVMVPAASAEVTAFIAGAISAALSIGGDSNLTVRSRQGGRMRSMQSRVAPTGQSPWAEGPRVAGERQLDGPPGHGLEPAFEQSRGGERLLVTGPGPPAGGVARPALRQQPPARVLR